MLLENQNQGQIISSQKVVVTCRLPRHFKFGKRQGGLGAATPADCGYYFQGHLLSPRESTKQSILCLVLILKPWGPAAWGCVMFGAEGGGEGGRPVKTPETGSCNPASLCEAHVLPGS